MFTLYLRGAEPSLAGFAIGEIHMQRGRERETVCKWDEMASTKLIYIIHKAKSGMQWVVAHLKSIVAVSVSIIRKSKYINVYCILIECD